MRVRDGEVLVISVRYDFTDKEKAELARRMSDGLQRVDEIEGRKKSVTAQIKAELEAANALVRVVAAKHRDGWEYRDTECEARFVENRFEVEFFNCATGEMVERRAMRPEERQLVLEDVVESKGGVAALRDSEDADGDADADTDGDADGDTDVDTGLTDALGSVEALDEAHVYADEEHR
jgi:hypothetical protein